MGQKKSTEGQVRHRSEPDLGRRYQLQRKFPKAKIKS